MKSAGFVHTQVFETLCNFTYRSSGVLLLTSGTSLVAVMQHSNRSGFHKCALFFFMHSV